MRNWWLMCCTLLLFAGVFEARAQSTADPPGTWCKDAYGHAYECAKPASRPHASGGVSYGSAGDNLIYSCTNCCWITTGNVNMCSATEPPDPCARKSGNLTVDDAAKAKEAGDALAARKAQRKALAETKASKKRGLENAWFWSGNASYQRGDGPYFDFSAPMADVYPDLVAILDRLDAADRCTLKKLGVDAPS